MTEGQSIAKDFLNEIRNSGHVASEREMAERIDAALAAARAGTGDEKVKSRGEIVAANLFYRESRGVIAVSPRDVKFDAYRFTVEESCEGTVLKYLRQYTAADIDSERTAAAEQMREACASAVVTALGVTDDHPAIRAIRAIPTEGAKP
jgi:hypothetical protein